VILAITLVSSDCVELVENLALECPLKVIVLLKQFQRLLVESGLREAPIISLEDLVDGREIGAKV